MKKTMLSVTIWLGVVVLVAMFSSPAMALKGQCSNCHTMHNSQHDDQFSGPMTADGSETPNGALLKGDCIGCHSESTTDNFSSVTGAPAVLNTTKPSDGVLAGGNFWWVDDDGGNTDSLGHNVDFIQFRDDQFLGDPPGWDSTYRPDATSWSNNQLTCAGAYGCHGNRTLVGSYAGISGAHHSNVPGNITGSPITVGASYRFLYGIAGVEDDDYEDGTPSLTNCNFYQGADNDDTATNSISYLCATCHGVFHDRDEISGESPAGSPWLRHPTDVLLPTTGEYGNYDPDTNYVNEAPVAWLDPNDRDRNGAVVMCLSCHRAHGMGDVGGANDAQYADMLRFEYDDMVAGGGQEKPGCLTCHNTKD